jgi:hypothetical protein
LVSLIAEETVTDELVDKREDDGVGGGDGVETSTRGEGQENARGEEEEEKSSRKKIAPHSVCNRKGKFTQTPRGKVHRSEYLRGSVSSP